jgi:SAM-dependent methyltransferase
MTGRPWDASYHDGPAPWDIGRPQPAIVRLASEGGITGAVLDAGCGTGENALHVASLGFSVLGFDVAETALAIAREKAGDRGIEIELVAADAFHLERLGRRFETVLDCGLFHTFDGEERPRYAASLSAVTEHDGTLYVLCFSDDGPEIGPHPVRQEDLRAAFNPRNGWNVVAIEADRVQTRFHDNGAPAWFATIKRTQVSGKNHEERRSVSSHCSEGQPMKMNRLIPMLPVKSMPASVDFYQRLGFSIEQRNDHWRWAMLCFDECRLMVDESINHPDVPRLSVLYLYPDDIVGYHAQVRSDGLDVPDLKTSFYGMTEFRIDDPDGNRLWIGQKTSTGA